MKELLTEIEELEVKLSKLKQELDSYVRCEYEIYLESQEGCFKINGCWIPISAKSIRNPQNIEKYISNGLLRKKEY